VAAAWLGLYCLVVGVLTVLMGEPPLDPPGWDCDEDAKQCWPLEGYHFEEDKSLGRLAAHDVTPTLKARQQDIDTAHG
jgi:hypothetical protein